jgi:hypothetical protein
MKFDMRINRCVAKCNGHGHAIDRRQFLQAAAGMVLAPALLSGRTTGPQTAVGPRIRPCGPASRYTPVIHAAFVRRKEEYGILWPGAIYDGKAAHARYTADIERTGKAIGAKVILRLEPIYSLAEADAWIAEAKQAQTDGLFLVELDRQKHAWPTAAKAADSGLPTVIFTPLGTAFTTNTEPVTVKPGCVIYSSIGEFDQAAYGMKMLAAGAKIRRTRGVVIQGEDRSESKLTELGIALQYVPAPSFMAEYEQMGVPADVVAMADAYMHKARSIRGATRQDVINGIKSYRVAGNILQREGADAISMDCLGALGATKISLPCIAWSRMNDDGIPAACEADTGAIASHIFVQALFDRPGFQQDPVPDTTCDAIIGAHCSCPTKLSGFAGPEEPFDLMHHHGNRDAVPRPLWKVGQRITCLDVLPGQGAAPTELLVSAGTVMDNINVPPAGGCVVSVRIKFDSNQDVLSFPGFHQLFFYGDFKRELRDFAKLYRLKATMV